MCQPATLQGETRIACQPSPPITPSMLCSACSRTLLCRCQRELAPALWFAACSRCLFCPLGIQGHLALMQRATTNPSSLAQIDQNKGSYEYVLRRGWLRTSFGRYQQTISLDVKLVKNLCYGKERASMEVRRRYKPTQG
jgi:hypothetical protein